jgi:hypothetical protein
MPGPLEELEHLIGSLCSKSLAAGLSPPGVYTILTVVLVHIESFIAFCRRSHFRPPLEIAFGLMPLSSR